MSLWSLRLSRFAACKFTAVLLLLAGCATTPERSQELDFAELESRWVSAMEAVDLPGFAVAVADRSGILYSKGFGLRSLDPPKPFTPDTSTYIASVTKVFVTMAIMQLAEQGKLGLDEPVKSYLPRFELKDPELTESITIRDLLCHRYGLNSSPIVFADAYAGHITEDLFYRELSQVASNGEWGYTNLHFTILGRVIEAVSGQSWKDYLAERVFAPIGMVNTTAYASELYGRANSAQPLTLRLDGWRVSDIRKIDNTMHAAGGMGSSAEDLARWTQVHLNGGVIGENRLISEASLDEILTVHAKPGTRFFSFGRPEMGLGWYLGNYKGELMVHHFGSYEGAHAHCSFMPEHGIGVAVVANSGGSSSMMIHQVAADVYDRVIGEATHDPWPSFVRRYENDHEQWREAVAERQLQPGPLTLSLPLDAYAGTYVSDRWGTLIIGVENETLQGRLGNVPVLFYPGERDQPIIQTYLGQKRMEFTVENDRVVEARIPNFWGYLFRFQKVS